MPSTRSSARLAGASSTSPSSSQGGETSSSKNNNNSSTAAGTKRKQADTTAATGSSPAAKRGRKPGPKKQVTLEETIENGGAGGDDSHNDDDEAGNGNDEGGLEDQDMKEAAENVEAVEAFEKKEAEEKEKQKKGAEKAGSERTPANGDGGKPNKSDGQGEAQREKEAAKANGGGDQEDKMDEDEKEDQKTEKEAKTDQGAEGTTEDSHANDKGEGEPKDQNKPKDSDSAAPATGATESSNTDTAVETSAERAESTPSSILEKGLIYFFFRGRVGIDNPADVDDLARSHIVLRPLPHDAKLTDGPVADRGRNRVLALPKKVLPKGGRDRFMVFVEKANVGTAEIKDAVLASSDYATKTAGTRHTPAAVPVAEGVYAITSTGRESHLAYMLTLPESIGDVQRDIGLEQQGAWVASVRNPQYPAPSFAALPEGPKFSQDIIDDFRSLRWGGLQPRHLDHDNCQFILIGADSLEKATAPQGDEGQGKEDTAKEELEKLEGEDELRVEHLKGDNAVFADLSLSKKEYSGVQTTW